MYLKKAYTLAVMALMVFILPLTMTYNQQQASANIISKPLTITAKKVAKDLAKDSAVAMAEHIIFEKAMRDFLDTDKVDPGYAAVCMDGPKTLDECPVDKRAQVKKELTSSDRSKIASTVEAVLEQKTNTSSKWQKFLDFFVPIFLISGLVATFDAMLDGDSESFIDEVAQQALIDAGMLKSLDAGPTEYVIKDFASVVLSVNLVIDDNMQYTNGLGTRAAMTINVIPGRTLRVDLPATSNGAATSLNLTGTVVIALEAASSYGYVSGTSGKQMHYSALMHHVYFGDVRRVLDAGQNQKIATSGPMPNDEAKRNSQAAHAYLYPQAQTRFAALLHDGSGNINNMLSKFFAGLGVYVQNEPSVPVLEYTPPNTDFGVQQGLDKTKNPDGTKTMPGVDSFTYTYNNKYVYPSGDSTTGWKDKTTGEDTTVVEDDVIVDDGTTPTDPETPPGEEETPNTDKDKDKIKDKSRDWSGLLTDKFPFSLPWDFLHLMGFLFADPMTPKWEIRGTEKIPLNFTIDLKFFDPYAPWFRTFIFISFVVSVIFMHGRFMGGSK